MANVQNINLKAQKVAEVTEKMKKSKSVVFFDYRGITVEEATNLRADMRKANIEYVVLKNDIVSRACEAAGITGDYAELLKGPNAFAFGFDDAVAPAKILKDLVKKLKKCEIHGGILEGKVESAAAINVIADLPPREVLIARLLGSMMSPISGLAIVLDQIAKQMTGNVAVAVGAEPAAPEAPVAQAPAVEAAEVPAAEATEAPAAE